MRTNREQNAITLSQRKVLQFLRNFFNRYNYSPTIAEIAAGIGIKSRGVVHRYLQALADTGFIKVTPGKRRNISLLQLHAGCLPLVGKIAAGQPIEAIENVEWLNLYEKLFSEDKFLLRVQGGSMIEENICDGDIVICQKSSIASDGQIVIALIDQTYTTLKYIKYSKEVSSQRSQRSEKSKCEEYITLMPANKEMQPKTYAAYRVQVQGIFVGLLRFAL